MNHHYYTHGEENNTGSLRNLCQGKTVIYRKGKIQRGNGQFYPGGNPDLPSEQGREMPLTGPPEYGKLFQILLNASNAGG